MRVKGTHHRNAPTHSGFNLPAYSRAQRTPPLFLGGVLSPLGRCKHRSLRCGAAKQIKPELEKIVARSARILDIEIHADAVSEIARRARGTPRIANRLLRRVRDYAQVRSDGRATVDVTRHALNMLEVDEIGLEPLDRQLLETVILKFKGGPVGLDTLATSLSEETETIEDVHEPFLIQIGFLARTARGRVATELAYRHLGITPPASSSEQTRLL